MKVSVIQVGHQTWKLPRCQADVNDFTKRWRDIARKDYKCERHARYDVDGKVFCKLHAGEALLSLHLKGGDIESIQR